MTNVDDSLKGRWEKEKAANLGDGADKQVGEVINLDIRPEVVAKPSHGKRREKMLSPDGPNYQRKVADSFRKIGEEAERLISQPVTDEDRRRMDEHMEFVGQVRSLRERLKHGRREEIKIYIKNIPESRSRLLSDYWAKFSPSVEYSKVYYDMYEGVKELTIAEVEEKLLSTAFDYSKKNIEHLVLIDLAMVLGLVMNRIAWPRPPECI